MTNTPETPAVVRDAENAARTAFQAVFCVQASFGGGNGPDCLGAPSSLRVASDRRLVIEYAAAECSVFNIDGLRVALATTVADVSAAFPVHLSFGPFSAFELDAGQQMRVYADPDTTIGMNFQASASGGAPGHATCRLLLSGYTVKL